MSPWVPPSGTPLGKVINAVLLLHSTSSTSTMWLQPAMADELFMAGAAVDANSYFVIIPDGIGRGGSSKPSDGLRMAFPHYGYADMVVATYRLLTEHLGVNHLRLVVGTSMGGMQTWMMLDSPVSLQQKAPSREAGDALYREMVDDASKHNANDQLYNIEAVMDYNPAELDKIKAKLLAINFADDQINPPELDVVQPAIERIPGARFVLIPASNKTHGHHTYFQAALWKQHLAKFMNSLPLM
jgi:homoserine O-acetyltransferase/O-succinyltransferase